MQIVNPSSSRAAWYDRNPGGKTENYTGDAVTPHAYTVRWTYTVPTAKKFIVENGFVNITRIAASTTQGISTGEIDYVPVSGDTVAFLWADLSATSAFAGAYSIVGVQVFGFAGDAIEGATSDASVGGSVSYSVQMKGTEFDA